METVLNSTFCYKLLNALGFAASLVEEHPMMSHKRLVAHLRVFFDKRSGKAERIEQFIAERGIENGLQSVTQKILKSPDCLYLKKSCKFLQS